MIGTRSWILDTIIPLEWRSSDLPKPARCSAIYQEPTLTLWILKQSPQHERLVAPTALPPNRLYVHYLMDCYLRAALAAKNEKLLITRWPGCQ